MTGNVTRVVPQDVDKKRGGFGFIRGSDGEDYFFHLQDCRGLGPSLPQKRAAFADIRHEARVEFDPVKVEGPDAKGNGRRATNVRLC